MLIHIPETSWYSGSIARNCCTMSVSFPNSSKHCYSFPFLHLTIRPSDMRLRELACTRDIGIADTETQCYVDSHDYAREFAIFPRFCFLQLYDSFALSALLTFSQLQLQSRYIDHPAQCFRTIFLRGREIAPVILEQKKGEKCQKT